MRSPNECIARVHIHVKYHNDISRRFQRLWPIDDLYHYPCSLCSMYPLHVLIRCDEILCTDVIVIKERPCR